MMAVLHSRRRLRLDNDRKTIRNCCNILYISNYIFLVCVCIINSCSCIEVFVFLAYPAISGKEREAIWFNSVTLGSRTCSGVRLDRGNPPVVRTVT